MKSITKHISDLLYYHDCVIIPGFGGLVANPVPAVYDEGKNMFFPPGKEIGFNKNLKHNDGLLINYIAVKEGVSYDTAKTSIEGFVEDVTQKLSSGETVSLGNIGQFKSNVEGIMLFEPDRTENFNTGSFGLSSFHFSPVAPVHHRNFTSYPTIRKSIRPVNIKHVAAGIAIVVGLFVFSPELKNPSINMAGGLEFITQVETNKSTAAPENLNATKTSGNDNITSAKIPVEEKKDINYFIIAGSFKTIKQANNYCRKLKSKGRDNPLILKSSKGRFRVAIDGFSSKEEALTALTGIRTNKDFKSAWLLAQK